MVALSQQKGKATDNSHYLILAQTVQSKEFIIE